MKIVYVVSTLERTGPTNQLLNIISCLDLDSYAVTIVTLSEESNRSMLSSFSSLGVDIVCLALSRTLYSYFRLSNDLKECLRAIGPDVIQTQGIRADLVLSRLREFQSIWLTTIRNYAYDDYPSLYGRLIGVILASVHVNAYRKCKYLVACSKTISKRVKDLGLNAIPIQNGVGSKYRSNSGITKADCNSKLRIVTVSPLIARKNVDIILSAVSSLESDAELMVVGGGVEFDSLRNKASSNVSFSGEVSNVVEYLNSADVYVSASSSEGLPNSVLEALSCGLPVLLSDIPPHREIYEESNGSVKLFPIDDIADGLQNLLKSSHDWITDIIREDAIRLGTEVFSASAMALKYQQLYLTVVKVKSDPNVYS